MLWEKSQINPKGEKLAKHIIGEDVLVTSILYKVSERKYGLTPNLLPSGSEVAIVEAKLNGKSLTPFKYATHTIQYGVFPSVYEYSPYDIPGLDKVLDRFDGLSGSEVIALSKSFGFKDKFMCRIKESREEIRSLADVHNLVKNKVSLLLDTYEKFSPVGDYDKEERVRSEFFKDKAVTRKDWIDIVSEMEEVASLSNRFQDEEK